jgi:hypothetical protein
MTEAEWRSCTDPAEMLAILHNRASERKLRLFACACCRNVWHLIDNPYCRAAVCVAEEFADGHVTQQELEAAEQLAHDNRPVFHDANLAALWSVHADAGEAAAQVSTLAAEYLSHKVAEPAKANANAAVRAGAPQADYDAAWARYDSIIAAAVAEERARQVILLRDLYPRPPSDSSEPIPETAQSMDVPAAVVQLAEALYAGGDCAFALHDALLEAGHAELAEHFQTPTHPKGCWALDLLLGKSSRPGNHVPSPGEP